MHKIKKSCQKIWISTTTLTISFALLDLITPERSKFSFDLKSIAAGAVDFPAESDIASNCFETFKSRSDKWPADENVQNIRIIQRGKRFFSLSWSERHFGHLYSF